MHGRGASFREQRREGGREREFELLGASVWYLGNERCIAGTWCQLF